MGDWVQMGMNKTNTLKTAFWKFLMMLLAGLFVAVFIPFVTFLFGVSFGVVTYADYAERSVKNIAPIIAMTPELSEVQLPAGCKYLLLDKHYQMIQTTLDKEDLHNAMEYATTGNMNGELNKQYLLVTRENEYVILQYYIGSQFTNTWLNAHLPSPEVLVGIFMVINCVFVCVFLTTRFAKNLRLQLLPFFEATSQIAEQNLDFEVGHSKIKEFEHALVSFSNMKEKLKYALEQQWKTEQLQREQIAALAHDLKTPLTVIQGNIDLINETQLDDVQKRYAGYIVDSSEQMQAYIKILIEISRASTGYRLCKETHNTNAFRNKIEMQIEALCHTKDIHLQIETCHLPNQIIVDSNLLERAILNIVYNALEYSPKGGVVQIQMIYENSFLRIIVMDDGQGFSEYALYHAMEQFYMEDKSRNRKIHFGMGLYIANEIAKQHDGQLILENSTQTGGAKVTLCVRC